MYVSSFYFWFVLTSVTVNLSHVLIYRKNYKLYSIYLVLLKYMNTAESQLEITGKIAFLLKLFFPGG